MSQSTDIKMCFASGQLTARKIIEVVQSAVEGETFMYALNRIGIQEAMGNFTLGIFKELESKGVLEIFVEMIVRSYSETKERSGNPIN